MSIHNGQQVWIAGKNTTPESATKGDAETWEFAGVFLTEQEAVAACKDWQYFIGPAVLGEDTPEESVDWEGAYYPLGRTDSARIPLGLPGSLWPTDLLEAKSEQHA